MRTLIAIAALLLSNSLTMADCEAVFEGKNRPVYKCDKPAAPVNVRVRCWTVDDTLLCNGEIGQEIKRERAADVVKPSNCGYRRGKYLCW